jgi:hypothetical protein
MILIAETRSKSNNAQIHERANAIVRQPAFTDEFCAFIEDNSPAARTAAQQFIWSAALWVATHSDRIDRFESVKDLVRYADTLHWPDDEASIARSVRKIPETSAPAPKAPKGPSLLGQYFTLHQITNPTASDVLAANRTIQRLFAQLDQLDQYPPGDATLAQMMELVGINDGNDSEIRGSAATQKEGRHALRAGQEQDLRQ